MRCHPLYVKISLLTKARNKKNELKAYRTTEEVLFLERLPRVRFKTEWNTDNTDHAPVQIDITLETPRPRSKVWKLNSSLLSDPQFCNVVRDSMQNYWSDNKNSPVSPAVMWDTAKATIHGYIISYTAAHKKALISKRQDLEKEVKRLEHLHSTTPTQINWSALCHARAKLVGPALVLSLDAEKAFDRVE